MDPTKNNVGKWLINPPPPSPPPPPNNQWIGNKVFQLIMKRIFLCNWFFIAKCIGDYVLDFVLVNVLLAGCWLLAAFAFFFSFSYHSISFHLIPSHFISFHLISFHSLSPAMFLQEMKWISIWRWINGKRNQRRMKKRRNQRRMKKRRNQRRRKKRRRKKSESAG